MRSIYTCRVSSQASSGVCTILKKSALFSSFNFKNSESKTLPVLNLCLEIMLHNSFVREPKWYLRGHADTGFYASHLQHFIFYMYNKCTFTLESILHQTLESGSLRYYMNQVLYKVLNYSLILHGSY